jgi:hypothetical protein
MVGGRAFILLKARRLRPESAKQAEICLACLWRILRISPLRAKVRGQGDKRAAPALLAAISTRYG